MAETRTYRAAEVEETSKLARTVVIQLILFLLPFLAYAIYRLLVTDAEADGRKTWPINLLFGAGALLTLAGWAFMASQETKERDLCIEPPRYENGVLIPQRTVPCERDLTHVGAPKTETPGNAAEGVSDPEPRPPEGAPQIEIEAEEVPTASDDESD